MEEKLVVRWRTQRKNGAVTATNATAQSSAVEGGNNARGINRGLSALLGGDQPIFNLNKGDDFTGLFVFSFDANGKIARHTIEHADEDNGLNKTSRVVTLTDWLLGRARWGREREGQFIPEPSLAIDAERASTNTHVLREHEEKA